MTTSHRTQMRILCVAYSVAAGIAAWNDAVFAAPATESASELLDDLDRELFVPAEPSKGAERPAPNFKSHGLPARGSLPGVAPKDSEDLGSPQLESPLTGISSGMRQAERLIAQSNISGETAQVQEQVLGALDELINRLQQQNQSSSQSQSQSKQQQQASQRSTPKPSAGQQSAGQRRPGAATAARTSSDRLEAGEGTDVTNGGSQELLKDVWGQLPERLRQQLLQSSTDEFLPQYRDDIERYFRRLADEDSESPKSTAQ